MSALLDSVGYLWIIVVLGPILALFLFLVHQRIAMFQVKSSLKNKSGKKDTAKSSSDANVGSSTATPLRRSSRTRNQPQKYE
mmetsp:Transcript_5125/g.7085  ORF Transcript_5125/g.7085 Transcript_5125/m.7085 type:complete len:82 (+) Transcript_5125:168-413(+)